MKIGEKYFSKEHNSIWIVIKTDCIVHGLVSETYTRLDSPDAPDYPLLIPNSELDSSSVKENFTLLEDNA